MDYFSLVLGVKNKVPVIKSMQNTKQSWKIEILKKNNLGRLNEREVSPQMRTYFPILTSHLTIYIKRIVYGRWPGPAKNVC